MKGLTDLDVYKLAERLSDMIWEEYDLWPEKARKTIGLQIIRSADSIAEGYGRFTAPDRKKFYLYARGSFEETKVWLRKAFRRGVIGKQKMEEYTNIINESGPKLNGFINSTRN